MKKGIRKIRKFMVERKDGEFNFGERIRAIRKSKNITACKLARIVGIHRNAMVFYEKNMHKDGGSFKYIAKIADTLGVSIDELTGRKKYTLNHPKSSKWLITSIDDNKRLNRKGKYVIKVNNVTKKYIHFNVVDKATSEK